jgi:Xaa-Pro aminopeptidase
VSLIERLEAAREAMATVGAEALLCADPANVHWLGGVAVEIESGPSPFAPPPLLLVTRDSPACLIVAGEEAPDPVPEDLRVVVYEGFTTGPLLGPESAAAAVRSELGGRSASYDSPTARGLLDPPAQARGLAAELRRARAVKDRAELDAIRQALAATDVGQAAAREACVAGATEVEILLCARAAIEAAAGERVPLLADLVAGPRSAQAGGSPSSRPVREGEVVLCDLAPRVAGTWGDSCATIAVGEPREEFRAAHRRVEAALERALEAVRPGVRAGDVDALVREGLDYPHHSGHGIGSSYYEEPRLVPGEDLRLGAGMVIALEPGYYGADFGVRLEHVVRVTEDGCEDLSRHGLGL